MSIDFQRRINAERITPTTAMYGRPSKKKKVMASESQGGGVVQSQRMTRSLSKRDPVEESQEKRVQIQSSFDLEVDSSDSESDSDDEELDGARMSDEEGDGDIMDEKKREFDDDREGDTKDDEDEDAIEDVEDERDDHGRGQADDAEINVSHNPDREDVLNGMDRSGIDSRKKRPAQSCMSSGYIAQKKARVVSRGSTDLQASVTERESSAMRPNVSARLNASSGTGSSKDNSAKPPIMPRIQNDQTSLVRQEISKLRDAVKDNRSPLIQTDEVTLVRQEICKLRDAVQDGPKCMKGYVDSQFEKTNGMLEQVIDELKDLRAIVALTGSESKIKKERGKQNDLDDVPFFDFVFSDEVMQIVIEKCTIRHVTSTATEYQTRKDRRMTEGEVLARGAALALRIMFFAVNLKKKESRLMYRTELGKKFSEYREGIVLTALNAAKQNKFGTFRDSDDDDHRDSKEQSDIKARKARIPKWLRGEVLNSEHITLARLRSEETADNAKTLDNNGQSVSKIDKFVGNTDGEIAMFAANQLYKRFTNKLTSARMMSKTGFFDELGYLFVNWKSSGCKADQSTVKIRWLYDETDYPDIKNIPDSIPKYTSRKDGEDEKELKSILTRNKALLHELTMKCRGMEIEVGHQVCIRKLGKKRADKGNENAPNNNSDSSSLGSYNTVDSSDDDMNLKKDNILYTVNFIDISCRLLSCYTSQSQFTSPASFLCASQHSLRCIFSVAMLLNQLVKKVVASLEVDGLNEDKQLQDIRVNGINLDSLLPTPARQKNGLQTRCVHMFQSVFTSRSSKVVPTSVVAPSDANRKTKVVDFE